MLPDAGDLSEILRTLTPEQDGLGCRRPHSAAEIAEEFGISPVTIAGITLGPTRRFRQREVAGREKHIAGDHCPFAMRRPTRESWFSEPTRRGT